MAPSRGLSMLNIVRTNKTSRSVFTTTEILYLCPRCQFRGFTSTTSMTSGHNRWSKIKHDKAKADAGKNKQRSIFAQEIATASRLFGADPNMNPRLLDLITKAKKEGFAKASIEAAIARGQGRSLGGASLENVTVEGMLPGNVAVVVECETDSKLRTLAEVRLAIKEAGGRESKTGFLFVKKGKVTLEEKEGVGSDEVLESALEAGGIDVTEDEHGRVVLWSEPGEIKAVGDAVSEAVGTQIATSEIVYDPNEETKVALENEEAAGELIDFVDKLQEKETSVQSVAMNVAQGQVPMDVWKDLQGRLGAI